MILLWLFVTERRRSDESKENLHARIAQLEAEIATMLRETLGAIHRVTAAVAESGREVDRTASAVEDLTRELARK